MWLQKKIGQQIFLHPFLMLFLDPGSGINIPDPQHSPYPFRSIVFRIRFLQFTYNCFYNKSIISNSFLKALNTLT